VRGGFQVASRPRLRRVEEHSEQVVISGDGHEVQTPIDEHVVDALRLALDDDVGLVDGRRPGLAVDDRGDLASGVELEPAGIGFSFVPISIAALAGIQPAEAGLASGLFNTSQQIGGALGIAALSTIATSHTESAVATGTALPVALVDGFSAAFTGGVVVAALGIVAALTLIRRDELETQLEPALEAELDIAA
jgi:hypothetical protein